MICVVYSLFFSINLNAAPKWIIKRSNHFELRYVESDKVYAAELLSLFELAYSDLQKYLKFPLKKNVVIFLATSQTIFDELTGNVVPHWGEGVADPVNGVVVLKVSSMNEQPSLRLRKLVKHELTHILVGQSVDNPGLFPKWFNEGIAIYLSNDEEFTGGSRISKALVSNSLIPLDDIDEVLQFHQAKASLAYEESYSFMAFLVEKYTFSVVLKIISELDRNKSFSASFRYVCKGDLFEFELQWYDYVEQKYRWNFLIDFDSYIWMTIVVIFTLAIVAVKFKTRRTLMRWEQEDGF